MLPKLLAIVGPTASGKTELAIHLAKEFSGEVICVDSRTVYRGMDIGTAKPVGQKEFGIVQGVRHWGLDLIEPNQEYSIAEFKQYAEKKINEIQERGNLPILVGGTGLWIDCIVENVMLPEVPPDPVLRKELEGHSTQALFFEYERLDPVGALEIDPFNKRRLVRALEVTKKIGKPFSELRHIGPALYDVLKIGPLVDRGELRRRMDLRVDSMIAKGFIEEVRTLKDHYGCDAPGMSGIGYRQLCFYLQGKANLEAVIADIKSDTWGYAKRQMTWFSAGGGSAFGGKRRTPIHWIASVEDAIPLVRSWLQA